MYSQKSQSQAGKQISMGGVLPKTQTTPSAERQVYIPMPTKDKKRGGNNIDHMLVTTNAKVTAAVEGLKAYYREFIRPLEEAYHFSNFHSAPLEDSDLEAAPMVLLIGQYSVGKTSFINYLIERDFLSMRIGPEPTTDRFCAVMYGSTEQVIPGNALASAINLPFRGLQRFGTALLNRLEASFCNAPMLQRVTFIDTPGVLSGEKQRINRQYNFTEVTRWFVERSDRVLVLFDAHKLDISDEQKQVIEVLNGHDEKVRCILNKADSVSSQQQMRVYGAQMWSLSRVFKSPEVVRVYTGSFWSQPLQPCGSQELLLHEEADLLADIRSLPRDHAIRRLNEMVKRCRQVKVHILIIDYLRSKFGRFGRKKKQEELLNDLLTHFKTIQKMHDLPIGDFPHMSKFRDTIAEMNIWEFPAFDKKKFEKLEWVLSTGIPELIRTIPSINEQYDDNHNISPTNNSVINADVSTDISDMKNIGSMDEESRINAKQHNPFEVRDDQIIPTMWSIPTYYTKKYLDEFRDMHLVSNKLSGNNARDILLQSGLQPKELHKIWELSDIDQDGNLDSDEYILAMYLVNLKIEDQSFQIPDKLDLQLIPPSKRQLAASRGLTNIDEA